MSMDLIALLKQNVSAIVLDGEVEHLFEKNQALNSFYPIFLSLLKAKPQLIESLKNQLNPKLSELFNANPVLKEKFLASVSGTAPNEHIENTLNKAIAPTLGFLEAEAGSSDPQAIHHLIEKHESSIANHLPVWGSAILAALGINTASATTLHQQPEHVEPVPRQEEKKSGILLPIIALLILAGLCAAIFKACSDREPKPMSNTATTPAPQVASTQPASLQLSTGADAKVVSCQIANSDVSYVEALQQQIKQIFTHPTGCGATTDGAYHQKFIDQDTIPSVLKMVQGVPNLSLNWVGDQVSVRAAKPEDAQRVANEIKALAKNVTVSVAQPLNVNDAVNTSITDAQKALASINPDHVRALDVATALNMQIINFATGSAAIPEANKSILDQAAALVQRANQVHLTVQGHTDSTGNADANKKLSQKRAQAVVDYLVSKGVDPAQLQAVGYGQERPKADNVTDEGKFRNRRIEFEVLNTETGTVRQIDEEGVKEQ